MPRIDVYAKWRDKDGSCWESEIGSIITDGAVNDKLVNDRIKQLLEDAARYEQGPITDMAKDINGVPYCAVRDSREQGE